MATSTKSLSTLLQRATVDDHEEILTACNTSLKQSKDDTELQHTRIVALLKLDRYEDALRAINEGGDKLKKSTAVERAYALYKIGELPDARTLAKSIGGDRAAKHVEAQASYRAEDFSHAAALYKDLAGSQAAIDNEENDIKINRAALDAQLEWTKNGDLVQKKKAEKDDLEAFETAYNFACGSIARGELEQGAVLLKRAKDLCNSLDDLTDDEKTAELLPIMVQQLYVLSKLGRSEDAEKLAPDVALEQIPDASTRMIAQNNKLASTSNGHPYLSQRLFQSSTTLPTTDKLFRLQAEQMHENGLALDLIVSKYNGVIKTTNRLLNKTTTSLSPHTNNVSILNAAAHAQNQLANLGLKQMLPLLEKRPKDIGLVMTIIQLYVLTNNYGSAVNVLESLIKHLSLSTTPADQDIIFAPGLVALQVSLYTAQDRKSQIKTTLAKAASHWRHKSKPPVGLLQAAGISLLDSQDPEHQAIARDIFSTLHHQNPSSKTVTAGYVAAHALSSSEKVAAEADTLTPVSRLIAGVDIAALEDAGIPSLPSTATTLKRSLEEKPKPPKKRRKNKLPKDCNLARAPDPERWLPLRDRSTYRPKGRKGRQKAADKTQGGVGGEKATEGKSTGGEGIIKAAEKPGGGQGKGKKKKGRK